MAWCGEATTRVRRSNLYVHGSTWVVKCGARIVWRAGQHDTKKMNSNGQEYEPLIQAAMDVAKKATFDTVGFVWMQGESDANNRLSDVYEQSFVKLTDQLKNDLKRNDLYYVIGRITRYLAAIHRRVKPV